MDTSGHPQLIFPPLEIAELKDSVLNYLLEHTNQPAQSEILYDLLKTENVKLEDFNDYLTDMNSDGVLKFHEMSGNRKLLFITDKGRRHLKGGGYSQEVKDDLNNGFKQLLDEEKRQDKYDLEITNLHESTKYYRRTRTISVWAIILSVLSLIASVLFKFI